LSGEVEPHSIVRMGAENRVYYVYRCLVCQGNIKYRPWKVKKASFVCRRCSSRRKPPPVQNKEPYRALYTHFMLSLKRRELDCSIVFESFVEFTKTKECHYCGAVVKWSPSSSKKWSTATNLDRKNNRLGYSVENCVVCCCDCNKTKGDRFTYSEFMSLAPILKKIRLERLSGSCSS